MRVFAVLLIGLAVEVTALVAAFGSWGLLPTLGLLLLGGVVGSLLLRREGARTIGAFSEAMRTRRAPHQEVADGVLIAAAGFLIVVPGFVSDVVGLFLLFPPTRRLISRRMARRAEARERELVLNLRYGRSPMAGGVVVDGSVVDGAVVDGAVVDGAVVDVRPAEVRGDRPELR
ncbi:FxsA family protein [Saccharothrix longispora]|uniref:FxsA family protein n=1 Tax=Saccharothrix longispora TaxID=33920 RepID=UPI0028FDAC5B|nr:FxsA family protein [Saccharothrix longispora]MDU0290963.1 FxsA family protein [Saccharothrix longispora]